jgi:ATP-dependent RNA helicase RhlE
MEQGYIDLSKIEILILDEADQMLDMGFIVPLRRIVASVPRERQTLMFSATMPPEIRKLAGEWLRNPTHVQVGQVASPVELVEQSVYFVDSRHKPHLLTHFLQNTAFTRTIVFARTKHGADKIVKNLVRDGIRAAAIHGNKSQNVRQRTLAAFKSNRPPVLVATDIAARGLDVDGISHVINYELPDVAEVYVHRIGRTGRAGATGVATTVCGREERDQLRHIERLTRRAIAVAQDHPEYPQATPATHDESRQRPNSRGARPRRPNGSSRPMKGGTSKSRGRTLHGQGATASNRAKGGGRPGNRRRRRTGGAKRRAL